MYDFPHLRNQCDYGEMEEIQSLDVFVDMSHMMDHMVHSSITSIISTLLLVLEPMAAYLFHCNHQYERLVNWTI
jgi:hypothetical protein